MEKINKLLSSYELKEQFYKLDPDIIKSCEAEAIEIIKETDKDIAIDQETMDLIVRPLSSTIALYEILLQNMFSFGSLETLYSSQILPDSIKANMLKAIAKGGGIDVFGNDPDTIYNQIKFFLKNNNFGSQYGLKSEIFKKVPNLSRIFFADSTQRELTRNSISTIQLNSSEQMNFHADGTNIATMVDDVYSREDAERYIQFKNSKDIKLPGMLDVYFDAGIITETIKIKKSGEYYKLPSDYYISIFSNQKPITLKTDDDRKNGIVSAPVSMHIEDGDSEEEITIVKYSNIDDFIEKSKDDIVTTDTLFKGFFPLFSFFNIRSRVELNEEQKKVATQSIKDYVFLKKGRIDHISLYEISTILKKNGIQGTVSSNMISELFLQTNFKIDLYVNFPLSMKDIKIPKHLQSSSISQNTISLKVGGVFFEKE